ncbi:hypothetical protein N3K66_003764 [Trichothecium roseum]|uniref:Uncharacterized protein n=1 Tax=Trichothecium roseum TaxID=47278 RepID=A0ACC0V726_9HYPO|nr:hypothetical protein N3K66_003764 [Trichothecium roseum]
MLQNALLFLRLAAYILNVLGSEIRRHAETTALSTLSYLSFSSYSSSSPVSQTKNIVIVGGNFAGHYVARSLLRHLPRRSPLRVIVVEPSSHFHFTWVFPRYSVLPGHEHKAFIPYDAFLSRHSSSSSSSSSPALRWIRDWATEITPKHVVLKGGEQIPYEYLVVATGSRVDSGLPSRANETDKRAAMRRLRELQDGIRGAEKVVVVGAGAAGVEVAADARSLYPGKSVALVHSRDAVMHRFGPELQARALAELRDLGVEVVLGERVVGEDVGGSGTVTLRSGRVMECDYLVKCTGQKPNSNLVAALSPSSISDSGHVKVLPTLQIADPALPNVYACGDVAALAGDGPVPNPNARSAIRQAATVVDNVLLGARRGKEPAYMYRHSWADGLIKLTLGLKFSISWFGDSTAELLFPKTEKNEALWADRCWGHVGAKPFQDPYMDKVEREGSS